MMIVALLKELLSWFQTRAIYFDQLDRDMFVNDCLEFTKKIADILTHLENK